MGRITKDVELKQTANGVSVCSFTVAVNKKYDREKADFINCIAWRSTAEVISKYFGKGRMIALVGSLSTGKYEKGGQIHYTTDVNVEEVYFADSKNGAENQDADTTYQSNDFVEGYPAPDDDLPF